MQNPLEEFKRLHKFYKGGFDYQTKELAGYLDVSTRTIQRWTKGITSPSEAESKKIQAYLNSKKANQEDSKIF